MKLDPIARLATLEELQTEAASELASKTQASIDAREAVTIHESHLAILGHEIEALRETIVVAFGRDVLDKYDQMQVARVEAANLG